MKSFALILTLISFCFSQDMKYNVLFQNRGTQIMELAESTNDLNHAQQTTCELSNNHQDASYLWIGPCKFNEKLNRWMCKEIIGDGRSHCECNFSDYKCHWTWKD